MAVKHASLNMREEFLSTMEEVLDLDPRVALVLADISVDRVERAARKHPDRVINVGIREQLLIGVAGGLALSGLRPVAHTFSSFLVERPYEQVKLDLTHQGVGAVLVSSGASYDMASAGRTHQAPGDVALIDALPGWAVHVPGHPEEARRLVLESLPGNANVYVRLSDVANSEPHLQPGFEVLREGSRGVVVAVGPMLDRVLAATRLMDVTVLYASTIRPFDSAGLIAAIGRTAPNVVLVEPYLAGTSSHLVSSTLSPVLAHRLLALGVRRDIEVRTYGRVKDHDAVHGLTETAIAGSVKAFLG